MYEEQEEYADAESRLDNDEISAEEEGFAKGYEDEADREGEDDEDDDERLTD